MQDLIEKLKLNIKIASMNYVIKESKISEEIIKPVLKIKEDFDLKNLINLVKYFGKSIV